MSVHHTHLLKLADMVEGMKKEKQGKKEKQLTKDTARAFAHTCRVMVALTEHLLCTTHE